MAVETAPLLTHLRERLVQEYLHGRRQRLFGQLVAALREALEQVAVAAPPDHQAATMLGMVGAVVRATGEAGLARALAVPLGRTLHLPEEFSHFTRPEVAWTMAETHRFRTVVQLPPGLPASNEATIQPHLQATFAAVSQLPTQLLDAILLSSYARPRAATPLVLLVPPTTTQSRTDAGQEARPAAGAWPSELAASTPAGAAVVDARAERLWLDEAVADVAARHPEHVVVWQSAAPDEAFGALRQLLGAALPKTSLTLIHDGSVPPVQAAFEQVLTGPPFAALAKLAAGEPGDLSAWPLACYRQSHTDADVLLPVAGRSGGELARMLERAEASCPAARLRLAPGLTAAQVTEMAVAIRRPGPPAWTLALPTAALPADPAMLRRAGLTAVVVTVGSGGLTPPLLAAVAQALSDGGLRLWVRVETAALEVSATVAELRASGADAISFHGAQADEFQTAWTQAAG